MCDLLLPENFEDWVYDYAPHGDGVRKSTLAQLSRLYPTVSTFDETLASFILDRTLHYMMHLDQTFDLSKTWDNDHYGAMVEQAKAYSEWLDSPDGTPIPDILKYEPQVVITDEDEDGPTMLSMGFPDKTPKVVRTPREKSATSRYQQAMAIHTEDVQAGKTRSSTLERFEKELGLAKPTANVYYSIFKGLLK